MKEILMTLFAMALLLLIMGCEKEETTEGTNETCRIDAINFYDEVVGAGYDIDFTYDGQERLIEVVRTEYDVGDPYLNTYKMEYDGDQLSKVTTSSAADFSWGTEYTFFYDGSQVDSIHVFEFPSTQPYAHRYVLPIYKNDKIASIHYYAYNFQEGKHTKNQEQLIEWTGDNITMLDGLSITYDDHPSPLSHIGLAFTYYANISMLSKNNVIRMGNSGSIVYTYNEYGYPATMDEGLYNDKTYFNYTCQ